MPAADASSVAVSALPSISACNIAARAGSPANAAISAKPDVVAMTSPPGMGGHDRTNWQRHSTVSAEVSVGREALSGDGNRDLERRANLLVEQSYRAAMGPQHGSSDIEAHAGAALFPPGGEK